MRSFIAPLTLILALAAPQDPKGQQPTPPARQGGFETVESQGARLREGILGAWQLTRGEVPDLGVSSGGVVGYALFIDGYMSFEIHVIGRTGPDDMDYFQTGTHRWKLEDNGTLETFSLIGTHNITEDEEFDFEEPGVRREYKVSMENDRMVLERSDRTSRFTFMRLGKLRFPDGKDSPGVDFYGRPIKAKGEGEGEKRKKG